MSDIIERKEVNGFSIDLWQDSDVENPNDDAVFLIYDHRAFFVKRKGFLTPTELWEEYHTKQHTTITHEGNRYWWFPVYAYIHSGISLSISNTKYPFTDKWDTSLKGMILVEQVKGWSYRKKKAMQIAEESIKVWNDYLLYGGVGYTVKDIKGEVVDSCGGYYSTEEALEAAMFYTREEASK